MFFSCYCCVHVTPSALHRLFPSSFLLLSVFFPSSFRLLSVFFPSSNPPPSPRPVLQTIIVMHHTPSPGIAWSAAFGPNMNLWALHGASDDILKGRSGGDGSHGMNNGRNSGRVGPESWQRRRRPAAAAATGGGGATSASSAKTAIPKSSSNFLSSLSLPSNAGERGLPGLPGLSALRQGLSRVVPASVRSLGRNCAAFGLFLGVFNGAQCSAERLRGRESWKNAFFAGFASAAMFGLRNPNPLKMVSTCALTGAFCAAVGQARDMNKKVRR